MFKKKKKSTRIGAIFYLKMSSLNMPTLINPLLNTVFNCPDPNKSSLKKLYQKLEYLNFMLVVPSGFLLRNYYDSISSEHLSDLSVSSYDFISSHIIVVDNKKPAPRKKALHLEERYLTLNGRDLVIRPKNNTLFTSNGFPVKKRFKISKVETLLNFNNYLKGCRRFPIIYVEEPLVNNSLIRDKDYECLNIISSSIYTEEGDNKGHASDTLHTNLTPDVSQQARSSFQSILHLHTQWKNKFNSSFIDFRKNRMNDIDDMTSSFKQILSTFYETMSIDPLFSNLTNLSTLIQDYIELNLYKDIWRQITTKFQPIDIDPELSIHLSLNQLDTFFYTQKFNSFSLKNVCELERNLSDATDVFRKFALVNTYSEKSQILINTLQILSRPLDQSTIPIDADSLISLFVLLINRTKLKHLKCHLYYLQNYSKDENSTKFGLFGYALSTLEAVICYIEDVKTNEKKIKMFKETSDNIDEFLRIIRTPNLASEAYSLNLAKYRKVFRFRNEGGESILRICILNFKNHILLQILSEFEDIFPLEDLLDDCTTNSSTLLMSALISGNSEAATILIDILLSSCTTSELINYFSREDAYKRNIGHYLAGNSVILSRIGKLINWAAKDLSGQTPLFTIFRSYDQADYENMVSTSYALAVNWYCTHRGKPFSFSDHEDSKGNTLLHVINSNISLLLSNETVNVNKFNAKGLTPLMIYAKYNRLDNIRDILTDKRLILNRTHPTNMLSCFEYAKDPLTLHQLGKAAILSESVFKHIYMFSLKYHQSENWSVKATVRYQEGRYKTTSFNLRVLKRLFRIYLRKYPMTFLPIGKLIMSINSLSNLRISEIGKIERVNEFLHQVFICIDSMAEMGTIAIETFKSESTLNEWIDQEKNKTNKKTVKKKKLEPEEISMMQKFLRFNMSELSDIMLRIKSLTRLATFIKLKSIDLKDSKEQMRIFSRDFQKPKIAESLEMTYSVTGGCCKEESIDSMVEKLIFFEDCAKVLIDNIDHVLYKKIQEWWKCYGELLELKKYHSNNFGTNEDNKSDIDRTQNFGMIGTYIENQKNRSEMKVLSQISDHLRKFENLNSEITFTYEIIAEELSKFMEFKSKFSIEAFVRNYTIYHAKLLHERLIDTEEQALSILHS